MPERLWVFNVGKRPTVGPPLLNRSPITSVGACLFRIRAMIARPPIMCFDSFVSRNKKGRRRNPVRTQSDLLGSCGTRPFPVSKTASAVRCAAISDGKPSTRATATSRTTGLLP